MNPQSPLQWGILGSGSIAGKFVTSARVVEGVEVAAAASRTPGRAEEFARKHGIPRHFDSYEALLAAPDIDAIYVANTHNFHFESVKAALDHGKPVLCEKPFVTSAAEARELVALAREKDLFLMEAMWTRFLPAIGQVRDWLAEGHIGRIRQIRAEFGFRGDWPADGRMWNPDLAGGSLYDMGIYPLSFISMVMEGAAPASITSTAELGPTGVDASTGFLLRYPDGAIAFGASSFETNLDCRATILGEDGSIILPHSFHAADSVELRTKNETLIRKFSCPPPESFRYQIEEATRLIRNGKLESPIMPLAETVRLAETIDTIRAQSIPENRG